jgi:hypothetical protein
MYGIFFSDNLTVVPVKTNLCKLSVKAIQKLHLQGFQFEVLRSSMALKTLRTLTTTVEPQENKIKHCIKNGLKTIPSMKNM